MSSPPAGASSSPSSLPFLVLMTNASSTAAEARPASSPMDRVTVTTTESHSTHPWLRKRYTILQTRREIAASSMKAHSKTLPLRLRQVRANAKATSRRMVSRYTHPSCNHRRINTSRAETGQHFPCNGRNQVTCWGTGRSRSDVCRAGPFDYRLFVAVLGLWVRRAGFGRDGPSARGQASRRSGTRKRGQMSR